MYNYAKVTDGVYYVGGSDRRLALFENVYPVSRGVSYNSYLCLGDKNVLLDTVDNAIGRLFFENLAELLKGRDLDYVIVNHVEPDHASMLNEVLRKYTKVIVVCGVQTKKMILQFFPNIPDEKFNVMAEGEVFDTGTHKFSLISAPMVHWPEVTVCYESVNKILFSADAFGTFGSLSGHIFADCYDFENEWLPDARRYYTNIVGKYGVQVQGLLKKAGGIEIDYICPLHGPIWRDKTGIGWFIDKYVKWSSYMPELNGVLVVYASPHGNTANAAEVLAGKLAEEDVRDIAIYDVSTIPSCHLIAESFKYSHIVLLSNTYNMGIFCKMEHFIADLKAHNLQNRAFSLVENGSWAVTAGKLMKMELEGLKDVRFMGDVVSVKSAVSEENMVQLETLAKTIAEDLIKI